MLSLAFCAYVLYTENRVKAKQTKKKLTRLKKSLHRHIKLTFVPHGANEYRPHLIRRHGLIAMLVLVIALQAGYNFSTTGTVLGDMAGVSTDVLLARTNSEREKSGASKLAVNAKLSQAAELKVRDMLKQQYWAHTAPNGATPWEWFEKAGYSYDYAGENLAKNFQSANAVVAAWLSSEEHRANVLGAQYSEVGFAVAEGELNGKPTTLVVALYGSPAKTAGALGVQQSATPVDQPVGVVTRLGMVVQSITPVMLGSLVMLFVAALVALAAHAYRNKLPKSLRNSWYRHHGVIKISGMVGICIIVVVLYSGGQI